MMNYRIYLNDDLGRRYLTTKNTLREVFNTTDNIIESTPKKHIIVISHNVDLDMDDNLFTYYGNIDKYIKDKERILTRDALIKRRELLKSISSNYTNTLTLKKRQVTT